MRFRLNISLRSPVLVVVALFLGGILSACGLITDETRIKIAQIGDEAITRGDLDLHIQQLPIEQRYKARSKQAKLDLLSQMVDTRILLREADKRGITATDEEIDREMQRRGISDVSAEVLEDYGSAEEAHHHHEADMRTMREQVAIDIRLRKVQMAAISPGLTVSDEEVSQFYEANKERLMIPEGVRIRYVTCASMEEAQKVLDRTRAGEDFAAIVSEVATETEGKRGLEWPPSFYMPLANIGPQALNEAIREAEPGDILGPIKRGSDYDIVQLIDRRAPRQVSLEEAKNSPELRRTLLAEKGRQAYTQFLAQLRESYQVKLFPENLPEEMPF